jgi:uncharacterized secreted protein with C-terminal beta-propeller domain
MNKLTEQSVNAFLMNKKFKKGNMQVEVLAHKSILKLHGNHIAYKYNNPEGTISIQNCGWFTRTTKERLNAIPGVSVNQKNFYWYLNGEQWDGRLIDLK